MIGAWQKSVGVEDSRNGGHPWGMPQPPLHTDRRRAGSFGAAAEDYDRYRPRYPRALITDLVPRGGMRVLDVGAGTGIASAQLRDVGADVLAVEPDPRMAHIASRKGIPVEHTTFEDWRPAGRSFDLVVFAGSFHWVDPRLAVTKTATVLREGGRLALVWNRVTPLTPPRVDLDRIYDGYLDTSQRPSVDRAGDVALTALLAECGFDSEERHAVEQRHYPTDEWLNMAATYSNFLTLAPQARSELRASLARRIGRAGVWAQNDAVAVLCSLHRAT